MTETEDPTPATFASKFKISTAPRVVAKFVVANSIRFVVTSALTALVPVDSKTERVKLAVGSFVVAELLADAAKNYIDGEIDDINEMVEAVFPQTQETQNSETDTPVHHITTL